MALQTQFFLTHDQAQVGLTLWFREDRMALEANRVQDLVPIFYLLRAPPTAEALLDRQQIGHWLHEFGDGRLLVESALCDVQPEFILAGGEGGPDPQAVPAIAWEAQAHFLEIPMGDAPAFTAARIDIVDGPHKPGFLAVQIAP